MIFEKDYLEIKRLYLEEGLSSNRIAKIYNVKGKVVLATLRKLKISIRPSGFPSGAVKDLLGRTYGKLKVIEFVESRKITDDSRSYCIWKCLCDCGNIIEAKSEALQSGDTRSCGCLKIPTKCDIPTFRKCKNCKECRLMSDFYIRSDRVNQRYYTCKYCWCARTSSKRNRKKSKINNRSRNLKLNYNITIEEFTLLSEKQNGLCKICSKPPNVDSLHVDHDHKTGKVRGLLCRDCNLGLGNFQDNIEYLTEAIEYLKNSL